MAELRLRAALPADAEVVFEWRNDPLTRAMSLSTDEVPWSDHEAWFRAALVNPRRHLFVALRGSDRVAFLRLDAHAPPSPHTQARGCTVSINVAPDARGQGLGTACLQALTVEAAALGFDHIDAEIRSDNRASEVAFTRAGYAPLASDDPELLRYRCVIAPG